MKTSTRLSALLATTVLSAATLTAVGAAPAGAEVTHPSAGGGSSAGPNLVRNPAFRDGLAHWWAAGHRERLAVVSGPAGGRAAAVTRGYTGPALLAARPATVRSAPTGAAYTAGAWVRASRPGLAGELRLTETGSAPAAVTAPFRLASTGWQHVTRTFAVPAGAAVHVSVLAAGVPRGTAFLVADVSLRRAPGGAAAPPQSSGTLFGATIWPNPGESFTQALAREDAQFGRLQIVHVYYPGFPKPWPGPAGIPDRPVVVSFNVPPAQVLSGADDAAFAHWFATAPTDVPVYWSYIHEPEKEVTEGQFTTAQYKAAWQHLETIAAAADNPELRPTLILMGYTLSPYAHRDWLDYYPGNFISVIAWDVYNGAWRQGRYLTPEQMYAPVVAASYSVGKPWAIAETASILTGSDADRAAWIRSIGPWLAGHGAQWVTYFDSNKGGTYELPDGPSQEAWRAIVTGSDGQP